MVNLSELFQIEYGTSLELNKLKQFDSHIQDKTINFVSRTRKNNGVSAIVEKIENIKPIEGNKITVAVSSDSVMEAFVQEKEFYTGYHIMVLTPKNEMNLEEKLFYCICIKLNKYRYNFGRQANKSLKYLKVPKLDNIPKWIYEKNEKNYDQIKEKEINIELDFTDVQWKQFKYEELFILERGKGNSKTEAKKKKGNIPFVTATEMNNGISCYTGFEALYNENTITIANNGSVGSTFFQEKKYLANSDVTILTLIEKNKMNKYVAMFFITLIELEKGKYNYGRKWTLDRMKNSLIKLPIDIDGEIDYEFMENYIKSLKYSKGL